MSYILDALKRAESERTGGDARQSLPAAFVASRPARMSAARLLPWGAFAVLVALATAFFLLRTAPSSHESPADLAQAPPPAAPVAAAPAATARPPAAPAPAARAEVRLSRVDKSPRPARPPELGTLRDLPEQVQREIPPLVIGGYLYSADPAERTVLINNRLRHEGDELAPGLNLESLLPNGMVLTYREYRYRSTY